MDCTLREMNRTLGKWIVHQVNGLYIKLMDPTLWKWIVHQGNGSIFSLDRPMITCKIAHGVPYAAERLACFGYLLLSLFFPRGIFAIFVLSLSSGKWYSLVGSVRHVHCFSFASFSSRHDLMVFRKRNCESWFFSGLDFFCLWEDL